MKVNFDLDKGINEIKLEKRDKNDLRSLFSSAGIILGGMLYESDFDINKLEYIELCHSITQMLETARFAYNWRNHERQEI